MLIDGIIQNKLTEMVTGCLRMAKVAIFVFWDLKVVLNNSLCQIPFENPAKWRPSFYHSVLEFQKTFGDQIYGTDVSDFVWGNVDKKKIG